MNNPHNEEHLSSELAREWIAALLSVVILTGAGWAFVRTYEAGAQRFVGDEAPAAKEAYERQKDLLILAVGLLGTVTGYYLGRVPAELRAKAAQQTADRAQTDLNQTRSLLNDTTAKVVTATQEASQVRSDARRVAAAAMHAVTLAQEPTHARTLGGSSATESAAELQEAQRQVEDLLRRL
jgi:hypothetical protein